MKTWLFVALTSCSVGANLEISRPVRSWEFLDAVGQRAGLLGKEDGTLEAYVYPLKLFKDLRLRFETDGRVIPGEAIARRMTSRPGSVAITYTGDDFRVTETLVAPVDEPGALILLDVNAKNPLRINVEFTRDFQLMWPASIGTGYVEWNDKLKAFMFGADGQDYAAVLSSPDATLMTRDNATNYSAWSTDALSLGTITGHAQRVLAFAGSIRSRDAAMTEYKRLIDRSSEFADETERHYEDYLTQTVELQLPDSRLQRAYDWSRISMVKGVVNNPLLGRGLVAGYGLSKGAYRPGFAWFFGRDSFWTSFALTAAGDFVTSRAAIAFVARYQREDGKIPHEIAQTASLLDWFKQFPYGYASADATPLFVIALRDYVEASGDVEFAREQSARLWKALDFMRSTLDEAGFPRNLDVGHGWVEGGPLLPIRVELYQAGCYVEALRSLASLARILHEDQRAQQLDVEFGQKRKALNDLFWLPQSHSYAFALDKQGKPVDQPSVLATVPMWFDLLDRQHGEEMIEGLAREEHAADWGMRIISAKAPLYDPSGYHYGSVWPLFTGWASVGEYRNHEAEAALANLRANAWLALDGAGGNTTEVLSGDTYSPLSTASPHQTWSAAMVVSPILRGLLGLSVDAVNRRVQFAPHLPADWRTAGLHGVSVGTAKVDLDFKRDADGLELRIGNSGAAPFELEFAPAYPPCARVTSASVDGKAITWKEDKESTDWHPRFTISVRPGNTVLKLRHRGMFGYVVPFTPPRLAEASSNLKVVSEHWSDHRLELRFWGVPGRDYRLRLVYPDRVASVEGGTREGDAVILHAPASGFGTASFNLP
ncbi:MAG TPA: hypothetical protein VKU01_33505 [Bryobacteraceae bacterium]|nr:hypothetical protein [Bryobacteraceae bacterium]